ncbi:epoxide hydrolase [Streptomyces sp. TG1A-8]|uniref:epoxide hydrolase family protein n=1 Tax=Streptomyces sp. TG1A-8 TaxID=3051385 RepID=UPI00265B76AA|nr:epoxide hydrolase [Streptomyces sp. TG1A-8]MDO0928429.1 epoxide hydrolase [Streptomyces sp. TG1A-8]
MTSDRGGTRAADVTAFSLHVGDAELEDLRRRLRSARFPEPQPPAPDGSGDHWTQGVPLDHLRHLVEYWADGYDWRRTEAELNLAGQWTTVIGDLDVHFLHLRSDRTGARPLLLTHGWPGSVAEFLDVAGELAVPSRPDAPAFHVVAPSLPGFGFSGKPRTTGWGVARIADAWATLMERLGYPCFLAHGGDWGGAVATELAVRHPRRVRALHTTFPQALPPPDWREEDLDPEEARRWQETRHFWRARTAYAMQQATRPQTLGYGLVDSPVALLAWIVDKFHEWTDPRAGPLGGISRDRILDNVMLYWLGRCGASAARLYWESYGRLDKNTPVLTPTVVSVFPYEIEKPPRAWVAARYLAIADWRTPGRGGHFPGLEVPDVFIEEIRAAFRLP